MIAMMINPSDAASIKSNLASLARQYCASNGTFQTGTFCSNYGFSSSGDRKSIGSYNLADSRQLTLAIAEQLSAGNPMLFHAKTDSWSTTDGRTLRSAHGTHFMVVCGMSADKQSVQILDPDRGTYMVPISSLADNISGSGALRTISY